MKPITHACLIKMCGNAIWASKVYNDLGMYDLALKYMRISNRCLTAASNKAYKQCFGHMAEFRGMGI